MPCFLIEKYSTPTLTFTSKLLYTTDMVGFKSAAAHPEQYEDHHKEKAPLAQNAGNDPRGSAPGGPRPPFPLDVPLVNALKGKRVILASKSLRRKQLLNSVRRIILFWLPLSCQLIFRYSTTRQCLVSTQLSYNTAQNTGQLCSTWTQLIDYRSVSVTSRSCPPRNQRTSPRPT